MECKYGGTPGVSSSRDTCGITDASAVASARGEKYGLTPIFLTGATVPGWKVRII